MKKLLLALPIVATLLAGNLTAQTKTQGGNSGIYISVHGGYNLPMGTQNISFFEFYNETSQNGPHKFDDILLSLGKGANFGLTVGHMFNQNLGAEIRADYLLGSKYNAQYRFLADADYAWDTYLSGKMIQLKPSLVFKQHYNKISPYAKVGLVFGVGSKITYEEKELDNNFSYNYVQELDGGTAVGLTGALGIEYPINNKISVFGEVNGTSLNYAPKKGKVTEWTEDGVDQIPGKTVRQLQSEFLDEFTDNYDPNSPAKYQRQPMPFSSIGLNLGLKFNF